ncbi:chaperone TorD involved in molybdoenzyme TorA maturation [Desulfonatronum thiosulfatophilum]|uniref:Chaperone TorD involved in molybdoenzyme TorA maturation n=1 Tax=Desulfonatronum thiosulfatophilum TaxID=617002 RepID=A0A1G6E7E0_9BACT|nr:molecular chaperone TorD family protein [Desulfonatronum thiosulfatophilum]SDB53336.1 chaperone TorD involved in molybdoenzyme TorA maturation [Desulfonatronum thiosulfatophilum]
MLDSNIIARMETYKALASCYFPPDEHLPHNVDTLAAHAPAWVPEVHASTQTMLKNLPNDEQGRDALKVEYAKLFLGPFEVLAPPFGSVYFHVNKMLSHESSDDAAARYLAAGVNSAPDGGNPPDHVTAELEFMYYLLFQEHAAFCRDDATAVREWRDRRTDFFPIHLGAWGPLFADRVVSFAQSPFYKHLGQITKAVLRAEFRLIPDTVQAEPTTAC